VRDLLNPYETQQLVAEYLLFHYGTPQEVLPWEFGPREALNFAVRCVTETFALEAGREVQRALDVGCAVGRSTFELSKYARNVVGIDFSAAFVEAARKIQAHGQVEYSRVEEGALTTTLSARRPQDARPERVQFEQGDAMRLRSDLGGFDMVLAANLIDRLIEPLKFLERTPTLVKPGGQLVLTSPYTWLAEFTPKEFWLGGVIEGGTRRTLGALVEVLAPAFELVVARDLPFLIREHSRKYQWSVAQATVWRRRVTI
jgi:putative 4-mercaptohistidine N1-methyltranferase